jgi:hypothetical protein
LVFRVSLGRPLNLFIDLYLVGAVYHLAVGNVGLTTTVGAGAALLLVLTLVVLALARLLLPPEAPFLAPATAAARSSGGWRREGLAPRLAGVALVAFSALGLTLKAAPAVESRLGTPAAGLVRTQGAMLAETWRVRARFADELTTPDSYADLPGLLSGLGGRDVLLAFVESYGMAALEDPEFREIVAPRLDTLEARAAAAGIHLATGRLVSPTKGGQSWYAHGTVISGLWLDNQPRYELLLASDRETLVDDFRHAGYRTAVLMPAITMPWPDAIRLGYDKVHTAENIPYGGPPLYWVTMPDQFTWSYLERTVRSLPASPGAARGDVHPQFVEIGMVSSHAPWTPILPMVEWDEIGDGSRFAPFAREGHPPEELWIDIDVLRGQYARSIDYALQAMTGYADRYLDERTLLIVMGDHQAAPWVTGATSADVPVHVLAKDATLLEPFLAWGFVPGGVPAPDPAVHRMDEFRGWFVRAFSNGKETTAS